MKSNTIHTIGRRKSSVARVYLKPGSGTITVNNRTFEDYFGRQTLRMILRQPLVVLSETDKYDISINVAGGGTAGQAAAARLGIARALVKIHGDEHVAPADDRTAGDVLINGPTRKALKVAGLLTRDAREVERKKYGRHKARRRPQFSKR
ncbi:MAG: 30S ribosomal protein S9 [Deltaproteobacteria bacterium]|nr:30S ribosomal protein S9 [Deltaproteobacteria bacterium]